MGKYAEFSQKVLENVGGLDNITFVAHCATRLRISYAAVSYTHLRAHETGRNLVCRLLLEKKKKEKEYKIN